VTVIPTITNDFDPVRVHAMLGSATARAAHSQALTALAVTKTYDGIDIDYESLQAGDRSAFSTFVSELAAALHAQGKQLSVTVHPKTSEPGTWDGPQAQDYAAIGTVADRVRVMAYDYHWATSGPGAIAPLPWVDQVAAFAASQIPASKIQLGIPLYGYDWVGSSAEGLTFDQVTTRRTSAKASRQWSTADSSPWFRYTSNGVTHEVWYEDTQSVTAKLGVVDKYGLAGAVFWRLGGEDAGVWTAARTRWGGTVTPPPTGNDTTAPTAPTALAGRSSGTGSVSLSWTPSTDTGGSGLAGYDVYRSSQAGGPFTRIASPTSNSFTDSGLTSRQAYSYYVKARDGAGNTSAASATVRVKAG
jgi:GH18 family chitinase